VNAIERPKIHEKRRTGGRPTLKARTQCPLARPHSHAVRLLGRCSILSARWCALPPPPPFPPHPPRIMSPFCFYN